MQGKVNGMKKIQWVDPQLVVFQPPSARGHCSNNGSYAGQGGIGDPVGTCTGPGTRATAPQNGGLCNAGYFATEACNPNGTGVLI